ncbi:MAG: FliI/YscN family ATPase [bacterium]|nr:FliI/YscN family ATPase [bacterium]MCP5067348.1 FliI/YscN family ATPase [bacterium]
MPRAELQGRVTSVVGPSIEAIGLPARIGSLCELEPSRGHKLGAEVVGFREGRTVLMALSDASGVGPGTPLRLRASHVKAPPAMRCLGRVIDGLGRPLDGGAPLPQGGGASLQRKPERVLDRDRIDTPLDLGVRTMNALLTVGRGARIGLFAGSGVGKSTLLGQIARYTQADAVVVGLVGERGREVREFVERDLGSALEHSTVVVATSDEPPLLRKRAALMATALAEELRSQGRHVLLLFDSLTRFCTALREIGLGAGEPPATRGYPPSVWAELPKLVERAGTGAAGGSITAIYTVLVEGDDLMEPVADSARALLDGHVVLSRDLAERGHHPAIDPLASVSRVMPDVVPPEMMAQAARARALLATYRDAEDLISIGAYAEGSDPAIDEARRLREPLMRFLKQGREEAADLEASQTALADALATPPEPAVMPNVAEGMA